MPVYEFACSACGHRFEEFTWSSADAGAAMCPSCGSTDARKLMSVFGIGRNDGVRAMPQTNQMPAAPCGPGCGCHSSFTRRTPTSVS
jgi:putative FmdB family regulatory protein